MNAFADLPGEPQFAYRDGELWIEQMALGELARSYGTPLFVYSKASILSALSAYRRGLAGRNSLICYAVKANSSLAVIELLAAAGCGFDIVSGGELERVLAAGVASENVIFSGVGKTRTEMRQALDAGIACFNVESESELELLSQVAVDAGQVAPISMRVNPNVDPKTHPYIATGLKGSKFGIAHEDTLRIYRRAADMPGVRVAGIDCHIGSQITEEAPYLDAMDRMLDLVESIEAAGIPMAHLDFGGGLGINYNGDEPPQADALWPKLLAKVDARGFGRRKLMIEPGRSLVGNAGACLTEVLYLKPGPEKNFCIVDAAMNDLPRPAMYQAYHAIVPLRPREHAPTRWEVVGPVCESGDWIGHDRHLTVREGDLLAVLSAGAYCMSMASNYNSRGRAAEVLVSGSRAHLIRERETTTDQLRGERLLSGSRADVGAKLANSRNCRIEMKDVHQTISDSIRTRRRLRFTYNGRQRLVEPQCYGVGAKGTSLLRAHQLSGGQQREPLFDVARIEALVVLDETFLTPGPNYKKNDSAMATILCQL